MIIEVEDFLSLENALVIDMRTEEEYLDSHIENAINFEILTYDERKEVSILYNDKKEKEAYLKAYEYALYKLPKLFEIIKNNHNNIVFYCARGGSRSSIVYDVFKNLREVNIYKIKGGYKNYRRFINQFFKTDINKYKFKLIDGFIGSDCEKLLQSLNDRGYNTINLNDFIDDSIFGIDNEKNRNKTQKSFDNFIFNRIFNSKKNNIYIYGVEKKKLNLILRKEVLNLLIDAEKIFINTSILIRVDNIYKKYFSKSDVDFKRNLINRIEKLRKIISNNTANIIINDLKANEYNNAIKIILENYCDKIKKKSIYFNSYDKIIEYKRYEDISKNWSE